MAAVASPRQSSSVRPNRNAMQVDEFDDVPVLLRLPNLRPDQPKAAVTSETRAAESPADTDAASRQTPENSASGHRAGRVSSNHQAAPAVASTGSKVLALVWRIGIVAAALALIVLAYRIINGPPVPQQVDGSTEPSIPLVELDPPSDMTAEPEKFSPPPKIVTPKLAIADDLSQDGSQPANTSDQMVRSNEMNLADSHEGMQPRHDAADSEWADTHMPSDDSYDELTAQSPADFSRVESDTQTADTNWSTTGQISGEEMYPQTDRSFAEPGGGAVAGYPQSDPGTWRTADQWRQASDEAAWEEEAAPPWHEAGRSAARLRHEIEQPPLNRDRLR